MGSHNPNFGAARLFLHSLANVGNSRMGAGTLSSTLRGGLEYYEHHSHTYHGGTQFHKGQVHCHALRIKPFVLNNLTQEVARSYW